MWLPEILKNRPHWMQCLIFIVSVPEDAEEQRLLPMTKHNPDADSRVFVIIGTVGAGNAAAEALRQEEYISMIKKSLIEDLIGEPEIWPAVEALENQVGQRWVMPATSCCV
jgi:hypothetical protein